MKNWRTAVLVIHLLLGVAAAVAYFRYWGRTRFWVPRYVHYLAAVALIVGIFAVSTASPDAPMNQGKWRDLKRGLIALSVPALVYGFFVFYGGQRVAHERVHARLECPNCRKGPVVAGMPCSNCGQIS